MDWNMKRLKQLERDRGQLLESVEKLTVSINGIRRDENLCSRDGCYNPRVDELETCAACEAEIEASREDKCANS